MKKLIKPNYLWPVYFYVSKALLKKFEIFLFVSLLQVNIFLVFSNHFWCAEVKNIFFKKIYYFDVFSSKKYSKKQQYSRDMKMLFLML